MPLPQPGSELDQEHPNQRTNQFAIPCRVLQRWNWHTFTSPGGEGGLDSGYRVVDTDVSGSTFGYWNGTVSVPRNIQLGLKLLF
jgi:hypothetical protein